VDIVWLAGKMPARRPSKVARSRAPDLPRLAAETPMTKFRTLLPVALLLSACAIRSEIEESRNYTRLGEHERAFEIIDQIRERMLQAGEAPSEEFEAEYATVYRQHLLERARQNIFYEREDEALVDLALLLNADPDHEEAQRLRVRALQKKAMQATADGDEHLFKNELEPALACYLEAEKFVPGYEPAVAGAEKVRQAVSRLTVRAQQQFLEAVRKVPEFRFVEVRWHTANAMSNDPTREDAESLKKRANHEIAVRTFLRGQECQAKDQFGAALVEYRSAKRLDEMLPGVDDAIAQMQKEVEASWLVEKATMWMRNGRFADAHSNLEKAYGLSAMARPGISELMIEARRLEGESAFEAARDLEILGKKREALAAFEALAQKWPDGVADEAARIDGLRTDIDGASKEWELGEAAEAANDLPKALEHFQTSVRFYAEFKNGKERIQGLQQRIAAAAGVVGN
jgi:tetratricopeptide (TPR) repeat protein